MEDNTIDTELTENAVDAAHVSMLFLKKKKKNVQSCAVVFILDSWINQDLHLSISYSVSGFIDNARLFFLHSFIIFLLSLSIQRLI